jgi:hypothetical protein
MRGTVYFVKRNAEGEVEDINRQVLEFPSAETHDAFVRRTLEDYPEPEGVTIEFGPVGPPWRKP